MREALYDQTAIDVEAKAPATKYTLRASGRILKFAGWLEAYGKTADKGELAGEEAEPTEGDAKRDVESEDAALPDLSEGAALTLSTPPGIVTDQKFTQPPARYSEGSLVKELEERGIGRPSTYAEIISKVQARDYVEKIDGRAFKPTTLGKFVVDGLVRSELDFMDPAFTSKMEDELDAVEEGKEQRETLLGRFYKRFREQLDASKKGKRWNPEPEMTDQVCDECKEGKMMKRWSKNGWFLGCSNYPKCKHTRDLGPDGTGPASGPAVKETNIVCDKCGKPMVIRTGRFGEFLSCTGYPECKNARPVPIGIPCPKCGGDIIEIKSKKRGGRTFYGCSKYSDETVKCDFKSWQKPIPEPCPKCAAPFLVFGGTKAKPMIACLNKECDYKRPVESSPGDPEALSA